MSISNKWYEQKNSLMKLWFREEAKTKSGLTIVFCEIKRWKPEHKKYGISFASTSVLEGNNKALMKRVFSALKKSSVTTIEEMREVAKSAYDSHLYGTNQPFYRFTYCIDGDANSRVTGGANGRSEKEAKTRLIKARKLVSKEIATIQLTKVYSSSS